MAPPNWSDPLPYRPVNNGDPPKVPLPDDLGGKGKKKDRTPVCLPYLETYGKPRDDSHVQERIGCTRNGMARLGRKIVK